MKYKITNNYCFHNDIIVDMYFVQGIPFTFDDIDPALQDDPYVNIEAENTTQYTTEDLYKWSGYLMQENVIPTISIRIRKS